MQANSFDVLPAFKESLIQVNEDLHTSDIDDSLSGTTCIAVCFLGGTIHVANIGDSRACLAQDRGDGKLVAIALSNDQTPFRKDERERCKKAGALVATMNQLEGLEEMHEDWAEGADMDGDDEAGADPPRIWWPDEMLPGELTQVEMNVRSPQQDVEIFDSTLVLNAYSLPRDSDIF